MKLLFLFICSAVSVSAQQSKVETILTDIPSSFRAVSVVDDKIAWVGGSKGHVGKSTDGGKTWKLNQLKGYEALDFRSCYAFDSKRAIIANAGEQAQVLKTADGGETWTVVFKHPKAEAFFDGIDFWNEKEGIIFGDPIDSKMLLLKTEDGGNTWKELTGPALKKGEASFAASGTTIRAIGKSTLVAATGGTVSRLWISYDKGENWSVVETSMVQGSSGSGIFSAGFYKNYAVMVGGDFENDKSQPNQSFYSDDAGKNWKPSETNVGGWRECVEYVNQSTWITTGPSGMEISGDNGKTWTSFSNEKGFHVIRKARKGKLLVAAGNKKIALIHP